jgi:ornithine carbamoyltransferase
MKHFLSIESVSRADLAAILAEVPRIKQERARPAAHPLAGQTWALLFSKSSTRTRVSFEVGVRELGGSVMFLSSREIQLGRGEPIRDTARVLGRMLHGVIIRTFAQAEVEEFARFAGVPVVNALTDEEHPCQILADIFTIQERRGAVADKVVTFIGDAACNVAKSWVWAAAKFGFELRLAAPKAYQPSADLLQRAGGRVVCTEDVAEAARGADVLYTDVWISMGKEDEQEQRVRDLAGYQINAAVTALASPLALVMHCLPAYRGKEIDEATLEAHAGTIFSQAENRLHVQKAILGWMVA